MDNLYIGYAELFEVLLILDYKTSNPQPPL